MEPNMLKPEQQRIVTGSPLLGASVFSTGALKTAPGSHSLNCLHLPDLVVPWFPLLLLIVSSIPPQYSCLSMCIIKIKSLSIWCHGYLIKVGECLQSPHCCVLRINHNQNLPLMPPEVRSYPWLSAFVIAFLLWISLGSLGLYYVSVKWMRKLSLKVCSFPFIYLLPRGNYLQWASSFFQSLCPWPQRSPWLWEFIVSES